MLSTLRDEFNEVQICPQKYTYVLKNKQIRS